MSIYFRIIIYLIFFSISFVYGQVYFDQQEFMVSMNEAVSPTPTPSMYYKDGTLMFHSASPTMSSLALGSSTDSPSQAGLLVKWSSVLFDGLIYSTRNVTTLTQSTSPFAAGSDLTVTINLSQGHHHTLVIPESLSIRDSTSTIHVLLSQLDFNRYNDKFIRQFTLLIENKTEVTNFDFKYLTQNEIDSISTLSDDVMQNTGVFTANGNSLTVRPGCRSTTPSCSNVGGKTGYTLIKFLAVTIPSGASFNQYLMAWGSWDL